MKKRMLAVLAAGAMVASMAACGGSSSAPKETQAAGAAETAAESAAEGESAAAADVASEDENTLSVYAWDANFNIPALQAAEKDYQENVNPNFKLNIIEQSQSSDVENAITLAGSSNDYSQLPDIVLFQDHYIQRYVSDYPAAFVDVEDSGIDWTDFSEKKLSYSLIDGKHYGVPVDNGAVIFAYRTDILEEAGYTIDDVTGVTWDEWLEIGKVVQEKTGKYLLSMDGDGNDLPYMMLQAEGVSQFKDGKPYFTENETMKQIIDVIVRGVQDKVIYLANDWSDYTDQTIVGDMVAGVMNGNWIIPTIEQVADNSGKWAITSMPTLSGQEGYAVNGGSSLYITGNCQKVDLAKDFLAKTFGGSTATYDAALTNGGVITCCISAGESEVYNQGVEYFEGQPIYADIVEMGSHVPVVEENDFHYPARTLVAAAITNVINGSDIDTELQNAEEQLNFQMEQ